jgi:hypothetical protein
MAALLALEAGGGLVIFIARLISGSAPGETLHVAGGLALTAVYAAYQWRHWARVAPFRARLDYSIGALAAVFMVLTNATGLALAIMGWRSRGGPAPGAEPVYPPWLSASHNIGSMLVLTFAGAHVGSVLLRDRNRASPVGQ